jgi:uncharacterized protein (DUF2164 family)
VSYQFLQRGASMANIEFSKDEKNAIVDKIQQYFNRALDQDIAQFDAEFLLDFFSEEMGGYYYNQALQDARIVLESKLENITDAFYELEKPHKSSR